MCPDSGNSGERSLGKSDGKLKRWLFLDGSRTAVATILSGLLFAFFLAVSLSRFSPLKSYRPLLYVLSGLIGGNLTIVTVVVSINQLLLSRELHTPPQLESQIDGMVAYRSDIEDAAGRVAPVEPLGFLRLLVETTRQRA
jgi:hypothetical protein